MTYASGSDESAAAAVPQLPMSIRRRGGRIFVAAGSTAFPAVIGLVMAVGGAASGDRGEWWAGIAMAVAFAAVTALLLRWWFRTATLTATTLTMPSGLFRRITIDLPDIACVGMVYTIGSGWLPYVWLRDGSVRKVPVARIDPNQIGPNPDDSAGVAKRLAATAQGRALAAVFDAAHRVGGAPEEQDPHPRRAGQKQEISFYNADPTVGVLGYGEPPQRRRVLAAVRWAIVAFGSVFAITIAVLALRAGLVARAEQGPVAGWTETTGTVVGVATASSGGYVDYGPIIEFRDSAGATHRFTAQTGSNVPDVGDTRNVSYNPADPAQVHDIDIVDQSWRAPFGAGIGILIFGIAAPGITTVVILRSARRKERRNT